MDTVDNLDTFVPVHAPRRVNIWEDFVSEDKSLPVLSHLGFTSRGGVLAVGYCEELAKMNDAGDFDCVNSTVRPCGIMHEFIHMSSKHDLYYGIIEDDEKPIPPKSRFAATFENFLSVYDDEGLSIELFGDRFDVYINETENHMYIHAINMCHFPKAV